MYAVDEIAVGVEELDGADAGAAVPEAAVTSGAIGRLVVDEEHFTFLAGDVGDHTAGGAALLDVPDDLAVGLAAVEVSMDAGPGLGEVEFVGLAFVPEGGEELAGQGQGPDLGPPAADVEDAVCQFLTRYLTGKVIRGEPYPGRREVAAPVLVGIAVAVLGPDDVAAPVPDDFAREFGFHSLGVPEHFEGFRVAEDVVGAEADVEGRDLADTQVPGHPPVGAHPFRMRRRALDADAAARAVFRQEAVVGLDAERDAPVHRDPLPAPEAVELRSIAAPGAGLYHKVRRPPPRRLVLGQLPEHGLVLPQRRVTEEEFDEECLRLPCLLVVSCE